MIYLTHAKTLCTKDTEVFDNILYPQKVHWFPWSYAGAKTGLSCPPHKLAERVLDKEIINDIKNRPCKTAFILAAGNSNFAAEGRKLTEENHLSYQYKILPLSLTQVYAGRIASMFGEVEYIVTDATACASSLKALMDVQTLIKMYKYERVIVLGVEDQINNLTLNFFGESGACLTEDIANKEQVVPSAFDSHNFGFHIGQGAVLAVFEAGHVAQNPIAQLVSACTVSEHGVNAIGQREDGDGFKRAIEGCIAYAGVTAKNIEVVKTHGTGTKSNNKAEKTALLTTLPNFVATSYKPMIGHTMGASGLLESVLLLESNVMPAIPNRTDSDYVFLSEPIEKPLGLMLSLAAGMGNVYSAAIFKPEKYNGS
jgi:3-oxoacyl-[acyl-carrier-protein] synthase II